MIIKAFIEHYVSVKQHKDAITVLLYSFQAATRRNLGGSSPLFSASMRFEKWRKYKFVKLPELTIVSWKN